jgi:hypothetical protein
VREIWQRTDLKNDRDRQAAKHLARINDGRLIKAGEKITEWQRHLNNAQFDVITTQADLQLAVAEYEYALLGRRDAMMTFATQLARVVQPDTSTSINTQLRFEAASNAEAPAGSLRSVLKEIAAGRTDGETDFQKQ